MINSKERKILSGMGQKIQPIFQIGKNGITDTVVKEIGEALEARELIKVSILNNSELTAREVSDLLCEKLGAEGISCVGSKAVIYRVSSRKDVKHIEF
ncbi:YhbY family RNA-binding protein [bacterium]|nr:YhbY family RNA-binding protein [bacterium]